MLLGPLLGVTAAGANVLGGSLLRIGQWSRRYLKYFIALGAGFMLATALLEMIPESLALAATADRSYVQRHQGGFPVRARRIFPGSFFRAHARAAFSFRRRKAPREFSHAHASYAALLGLGIHTFFDGVAIASGFLVSSWLGGVIFVAIFLHKLPEGFTVASLMLASGQSRRRGVSFVGDPGRGDAAGMALMFALRGTVPDALPLSAGVTLYVAASDLIPEVNREPAFGMAVLVFLGVA